MSKLQDGLRPGLAAAEEGRRSERGQTLVIVAVLVIALVGFLALSIDVGNIYAQRRFAQNAADAGALAGARALARGEEVGPQVDQYVKRNGGQSYECSIVGASVVVTVHRNITTYFAAVVNVPTFDVLAAAQAGWKPAGYGCVMPIALLSGTFVANNEYTIWDSEKFTGTIGEGIIGSSQRGWLDLDGDQSGGESELSTWIGKGGYDGEIIIGNWYHGDTGAKVNALSTLDDLRTASGGKLLITVPVFDVVDDPKAEHALFHVVGFAKFLVTDVETRGAYKYLKGSFVGYVDDCSQEAPDGTPDFGLRVVRLWR